MQQKLEKELKQKVMMFDKMPDVCVSCLKDFDIKEGYDKLKHAIETHDDTLEEYNERSEDVLSRYCVDHNRGLLKTYIKLLKDLMSGERTSSLSYDYDWKTNLYKK